jgi:hypothetical protein
MTVMHTPIHVSDLEVVLRRVARLRAMSGEPDDVRKAEVRKANIEAFSALTRVNAAHDTWEPHQIYVFHQLVIERTKPETSP